MPERWSHYFAEVCLKDRWVFADATFDKALTSDADDWDDENNVCSITAKAILSDMGAFAFIEDAAKRLDEKYKVPVFWILDGCKFFWILIFTKDFNVSRTSYISC